MENVDGFFRTIERRIKRSEVVLIVVSCLACVVALGSAWMSFQFASGQREQIYVLDQGKSLIALQADGAATKDLEAMDHVRHFHELFFTLAPNKESIDENINQALKLADKSAYDYWNDLSEKKFYTLLVSGNVSQEMVVDSVKVNTSVYPYDVHTWAHYYQVRTTNVSLMRFESTCGVRNVARSVSNPHGMMIEGFTVTVNELVQSKDR